MPDQVRSRQRPRPARRRRLRALRQQDRKRLRPRIADASVLLRYAVLRGTRDRHQKPREESVMKCSNPDCNRGIGLVAYRRGWFSKRRCCSRNCRDAFVTDLPKRSEQERRVTTYFEWLFLQPIENPQQKLKPGHPYKGALRTTRIETESFSSASQNCLLPAHRCSTRWSLRTS
jgi:hypothetical protein